MDDWIIIGAVMLAALAVSLGFWLVLMPRLSATGVSKKTRVWGVVGFGLVLVLVPIAGLLLIERTSVVQVCALIVGWAMSVRATAWFAARKCLVPRLRAMRGDPAASLPNDAANGPPAA